MRNSKSLYWAEIADGQSRVLVMRAHFFKVFVSVVVPVHDVRRLGTPAVEPVSPRLTPDRKK